MIFNKKLKSPDFSRIYHLHIRKCAGTSINKAFTSFPDNNRDVYLEIANAKNNTLVLNKKKLIGWNLKELRKQKYWYGFSHHSYEQLAPFKKDTYVFTFLRDPVDRVVSHYKMLKDWEAVGSNHPAYLREKKWIGLSFKDFIENIPRKHLQNQLFMFSEDFDVNKALLNIKKLQFIGIVGRDEDKFLNELNSIFEIKLGYKHIRKAKLEFKPNFEELEILKHILKEEIDFFNKVEDICK